MLGYVFVTVRWCEDVSLTRFIEFFAAESTRCRAKVRQVGREDAGVPAASFAFPPTLTGIERKTVHTLAESLGLTSQSFGAGPERSPHGFIGPSVSLEIVGATSSSGNPFHTNESRNSERSIDLGG